MDKDERARRIGLVTDQHRGILPTFEAFYIQSLLYLAQAANDAFERFASAMAQQLEDAVVVAEVQEALTHAAALSRFFWPASDRSVTKARAEKLCNAFKMEGSPLKDRGARNALEHFDERLDEYFLKDPVGVFLPTPLVREHEMTEEAIDHVFRLVDPSRMVFVILDEKYEFGTIWEEVKRILHQAHMFDQNGGRLR